MKNLIILCISVVTFSGGVFAQGKVINEVVAVIGNKIVMTSDIEERVAQMVLEGSGKDDKDTRCEVYEENIYQKMLVYRATVDSIEVSDEQVEGELERRINYFIRQFPSQEAMEEYLGKTITEIKKEFRSAIEEQLLVQQMQEKVSGSVKVTPGEVRAFYATIPEDSLPYIPSEIEYAQIVIKPRITEDEKRIVRDKLNKIRNDILRGSSFALKARVNSMDRGSAENGGELGFMTREDLVPEFAAVAFRLKPGEISEIVESEFGFHIIELVEKRGTLSNFRHILLRPEVSDDEFIKAQIKADSIYNLIGKNDTLTFEKVAELFSDDEETKLNGGRVFNYQSGSGRFKIDQMQLGDYKDLSSLEPGQYTRPHVYTPATSGIMSFRIQKLSVRTQPHVADLVEDYQIIQSAALSKKQNEAVVKYINKMKQTMYIQISPEYKTCKFQYNWETPVK